MTKVKNIFFISIVLLILSGISIISNHHGFALRIFILNFWLLFIGTFKYIWESRDES